MIYGSVCSGIEAATVAWHPLGWTPAFFAEIDAFPSAVLAERWPGVPNLGDFTKIGSDHAIDLLVGGTSGARPPTLAGQSVRRLIPRECERLQGFPDDYTLIDYRGRAAADGPRYRALGNSMAVPVMRWIGERIAIVDAATSQKRESAA